MTTLNIDAEVRRLRQRILRKAMRLNAKAVTRLQRSITRRRQPKRLPQRKSLARRLAAVETRIHLKTRRDQPRRLRPVRTPVDSAVRIFARLTDGNSHRLAPPVHSRDGADNR
jgi:hypothetical protein